MQRPRIGTTWRLGLALALLGVGTVYAQPSTRPSPPSYRALQRLALDSLLVQIDTVTGLPLDGQTSTAGYLLTAYPVAVERGALPRAEAAARTLHLLQTLWTAPQSLNPAQAAGFRGFFYTRLDPRTGRRQSGAAIGTLETARLVAGALTAATYFRQGAAAEVQIRAFAEALYRRVDWRWMLARPPALATGWQPEAGLMRTDLGPADGLIAYVLALGAPSFSIPGRARFLFDVVPPDAACAAAFASPDLYLWLDLRGATLPAALNAPGCFRLTDVIDARSSAWLDVPTAPQSAALVGLLENQLTGRLWTTTQRSPALALGLDRVGVTSPWIANRRTVDSRRTSSYHVVVIGSSTAEGVGATDTTRSWVHRYRSYLRQRHPGYRVTNLARRGYSTYHLLPSGTVPPANRPAPDPERNITAALALRPSVLILNLPSNDASQGYAPEEQLRNYETLVRLAAAQGVPVWVTTTQPRTLGPTGRALLRTMRTRLTDRFAPRVLDFWTDFANPDGTPRPAYNSGDGIHVNDLGHTLLFERVVASGLADLPPEE